MIRKSGFGGFELYFTFTPANVREIEVLTNVKASAQFLTDTSVIEDMSIRISSLTDTNNYIQVETLLDGIVVDRSDFSSFGSATVFSVRVFMFNQYISVLLNDFWSYSYAFSRVEYQTNPPTISLKALDDNVTVTNVRRVELSDGREAVFVDYQASTENAIQSIIQQRPIMITPGIERNVNFTYNATKDTINALFVEKFKDSVSDSTQIASDALVYYSDVGISLSTETLKEVGFITRLYRLSELDTGAEQAAETMQRRALENRHRVQVDQRLDPRIEVSDILHVSLTAAGTTRVISRDVVVEDVSISIRDGNFSASISGRYNYE